jgi:hypothetical protein
MIMVKRKNTLLDVLYLFVELLGRFMITLLIFSYSLKFLTGFNSVIFFAIMCFWTLLPALRKEMEMKE